MRRQIIAAGVLALTATVLLGQGTFGRMARSVPSRRLNVSTIPSPPPLPPLLNPLSARATPQTSSSTPSTLALWLPAAVIILNPPPFSVPALFPTVAALDDKPRAGARPWRARESFLEPLGELLLTKGKVGDKEDLHIVIFGAGCAVAAVLLVILDCCTYAIKEKSFLRYRHSRTRIILLLLVMPVITAIVGIFGRAIDILQPTRATCVVVGVAWPSLIAVLLGVEPEPWHPTADEDNEAGGQILT